MPSRCRPPAAGRECVRLPGGAPVGVVPGVNVHRPVFDRPRSAVDPAGCGGLGAGAAVLHGLSDRQAAEAVLFDLRWKAACGLAITDTSFHPTTLTYWRQRLAASDSPNRIFDAVKAVVVATGVLKGKTRRALDSTVLDDAVATGGHRDAVGRGDPPGGPGGARRRSGGRVDIDGPLRPARRTRHRLGRPSRSALLVGGHPGPGTCWRCWPL